MPQGRNKDGITEREFIVASAIKPNKKNSLRLNFLVSKLLTQAQSLIITLGRKAVIKREEFKWNCIAKKSEN